MSKKSLNTEEVLSELTGQSVFFPKSTLPSARIPSAAPQELPQTERTDSRTDIRTDFRSEKRSVLFPLKRMTRRYSFEFFNDQITKLKSIKHDYEMMGENVTMSDIVREALDEYLNKDGPADRTENRSEDRSNGNPNE
jgi:hypothetical protein